MKYNKEQIIDYLKKHINRFQKYYNDSDFLKKVKKLAKTAGVNTVYMALKIYYGLKSDALSTQDKVLMAAALGYFICPFDLIPDFLGLPGLVDDGIILSWVMKKVSSSLTPEVDEEAKAKLKSIFGDVKV